ncbi:phage tail tube protein [Rhodoblastus sp. 17X3]|uniref:phage tail tube protein n=1 Tax=Rhodoblastus sp. 17X3 TaxID=3047026 RepID=UPI0024B72BE9|nr:phage tail tube protein [Rhodoblastus sp. 17X3]MDI9847372.1 phage tail tube protein [Rhodoblastus sp. 17X3]
MTITLDSNSTQLSGAAEVLGSPGTLPGTPVWYVLQPNNYSDFGAKIKTAPRMPITQGRQRLKGPLVDLDAAGSFEVDFSQNAFIPFMPGLFFAAWRNKCVNVPSAVSSTVYTVASATGAVTNSLVVGTGFGVAGNNGLKLVTAVTGTTIACSGLAVETPPSTALLSVCGVQGVSGDLQINAAGSLPQITSTTLDFTTLGLLPGEWIYIGGDSAPMQFANAANNGWARVSAIAAHALTLDRWPGIMASTVMATDTGSSKTVQIFFGNVIRNEPTAALITKQSYALERQIASGDYETLTGMFISGADIKISAGQKITFNLQWAGKTRTTSASAASGTRVPLVVESAFNATSNASLVQMVRNDTNAPIFAYITDTTLSVKNNLTPVKAVGVLGSIDQTAGFFEAGAQTTAYYTTEAALTAIINNVDFSTSFGMAAKNAGWIFDLPTAVGSDATIKVELNKPITLPLKLDSAENPTYLHSMLAVQFPYLPTVIAP